MKNDSGLEVIRSETVRYYGTCLNAEMTKSDKFDGNSKETVFTFQFSQEPRAQIVKDVSGNWSIVKLTVIGSIEASDFLDCFKYFRGEK